MLEKIMFILISVAVGFFSGLFWDRVTQKRNKKGNDRDALLKAIHFLSDIIRPIEAGKSERSSFENFDELKILSLVIQCKENKDLAGEIQKFVKENRGQEVISNHPLRNRINSLKEKIEERFKQ
ncbi:hypothetical protein ES703_60197 [subsurface metagenome]